jgi:hypothetical protein
MCSGCGGLVGSGFKDDLVADEVFELADEISWRRCLLIFDS